MAGDDTFELRSSRHVWGTCTFAHARSRNPKQPHLIQGHNWVVLGRLLPGRPWTYLPTAARLYLRRSQRPAGVPFATKDQLLVARLRQFARLATAPLLGIVDGGYAHRTVVRCGQHPPPGQQPIAILTRPRSDARLYAPLPPPPPPAGGRPRRWGPRLPRPREYAQWAVPWQEGTAWIDGRRRPFRAKRLPCRWSVSGPAVPVGAYALEVEGYAQPWFLITDALDLSAAQVLAAYAARFRQEDGIRDHKQLLGMQEVRAWTQAPVRRTFLAQLVAQSLLRLRQRKLARPPPAGVAPATPWNRHRRGPSLRDARRLVWRHRQAFSHFARRLHDLRKPPHPHLRRLPTRRGHAHEGPTPTAKS